MNTTQTYIIVFIDVFLFIFTLELKKLLLHTQTHDFDSQILPIFEIW